MLFSLLACALSTADSPAGDVGLSDPSAPPLAQPSGLGRPTMVSVAAPPPGLTVVVSPSGNPVACPEPIYAAQSGASTGEPVLADPDSSAFGEASAPIHAHPQWTGDPSRTVSILWQTDSETLASQVAIGEERGEATVLSVVPGASFLWGATAEDGRVHEVHVCGLIAGTDYRWKVGGADHWGEEHLHTTAPRAGTDTPVRFAVSGDSRDGMQVFRAVIAGGAARGAQFRVLTGDAVAYGEDVDEWNAWFDAGAGFLEASPTVSADGNHEALSRAFLALFAQPGNEQYFSFDYANVHFVILNDSPVTPDDFAVQAEWLAADLAGTLQPWKLVFHHRPAFTASLHPADPDVLEWFVPVEEAGGVAVDFAGHNHNYERSSPLRAGKVVADTEGTTYVVTAGGGAGLYTNYMDKSEMIVGIVAWHYVIVDVDGPTLTLYAYDLTGNLLDTFRTTR